MDKKLSDDSQQLGIFKRARVLGQSHQSFILLVKTWIEDTVGDDRGRPRQGRQSSCLTSFIWDDDEDGVGTSILMVCFINPRCALSSPLPTPKWGACSSPSGFAVSLGTYL